VSVERCKASGICRIVQAQGGGLSRIIEWE
jgi:hypothetical protein